MSRANQPPLPPSKRFFKIILPNTDQHRRIPPEFVRHHGGDLADRTVYFKVPTGILAWPVESIRRGRFELWFEKGWQQFAQHYSLCDGDFLMFTYEGNSTFLVNIFDQSATEIKYPTEATALKDEGTENDTSVEITGGKRARREGGESSKRERSGGNTGPKCPPEKEVGVSGAMERAKAFQPANPYCVVRMQPSYVGHKFRLPVPLAFAKRVFRKRRNDFTLRVADHGGSWSLQCNMRSSYAEAVYGWKKFAQDNNVRVGDVCVLEHVSNSGDGAVLMVTIFRA